MVTSKWVAKLSEYALDPYLKLTRGGMGEAGGVDLLPPEQHPANSVLFLSPEKCSGQMAATVHPQRLPTSAKPIAPRRGWAGELRRRAQRSGMPRGTAAPSSSSDTQPDEPMQIVAKWLGEQRADVWAFSCLLTSLAQHQKRAKELSSKAGSHASSKRGGATLAAARRHLEDDMYGWDEYTSVSKDRPGRCSPLRHAAEAEAAEDRPYGPRTLGVDLRLKAVGEVASHLKRSRLSPGISRSDHCEHSSNAPEADAPLPSAPSAPPSPPTSPVQGAVSPVQGAVSDLTPEAPSCTLSAREALQPGPPITRPEQSRMPQPTNASKAAMVPRPRVPPTPYVLMLRLCQDKVSPLDGVTPSCCPRPLLQLATQCCARDPEERPSIEAVLEQLQGKVLRWIDSAAYGAGAGAQRPLTALEGWCAAAERTFLGTEPADDEGSGALGPAGAHTSTAARLRQAQSESLQC